MSERLRPEELVHGLQAARAPAFIPGRDDRLAYLRRRPDAASDRDIAALELLELDTGRVRCLRSEQRDVRHFAFDSTGRHLATVEGEARTLVATAFDPERPDAGASRDGPSGIDAAPAWAPAGSRLALTLAPPAADAGAPQVVTGRFYKEDGCGFVGGARRQVLVYDTAAGEPLFRTHESEGASLPAWAPDSSVLAVRTGGANGWPCGSLAVLDAGSGAARARLERYAGTVEAVVFAGRDEVVFVGSARRPLTFQTDVLAWRWEADELRVVAEDLPWQVWSVGFHVSAAPVVRREARTLWLGGVQRGGSGLYELDLDSGRSRKLHADRGLRGGLAVSSDGELVVRELSTVDSFGELVVLRPPEGSEHRLTTLNRSFSDRHGAPRLERLQVQRPGFAVDTWVLQAADADAAAPVVLDIHGGPHNFYGEFFLPEHQLMAANGFVVVYCNPRGSGSYGSEFAAATAGAWGTADSDDIMAALDSALATLGGRRDVFASGWSYGGFQVLTLLCRHPQRFKAAACGAPAADFRSWYGTSDSPVMAVAELGGRPHELPTDVHARSPAERLHELRTPLLLLHGLADMRSPVAQTELVHRIVADAGGEVRYVRYPGASHGFRHTGRLSQRVHVLGEIVRWFESHATVCPSS